MLKTTLDIQICGEFSTSTSDGKIASDSSTDSVTLNRSNTDTRRSI